MLVVSSILFVILPGEISMRFELHCSTLPKTIFHHSMRYASIYTCICIQSQSHILVIGDLYLHLTTSTTVQTSFVLSNMNTDENENLAQPQKW